MNERTPDTYPRRLPYFVRATRPIRLPYARSRPESRGGPRAGPAPFKHPSDVLHSPDLTRDEKRAFLASWASDAWAVVSRPALRDYPGSEGPVHVDDVLEALRALDAAGGFDEAASVDFPAPPRAMWARPSRLVRRWPPFRRG